ncbi:hypothetical protein RCL1_007647 [Eukaryota sp. TZLM3-RCL]
MSPTLTLPLSLLSHSLYISLITNVHLLHSHESDLSFFNEFDTKAVVKRLFSLLHGIGSSSSFTWSATINAISKFVAHFIIHMNSIAKHSPFLTNFICFDSVLVDFSNIDDLVLNAKNVSTLIMCIPSHQEFAKISEQISILLSISSANQLNLIVECPYSNDVFSLFFANNCKIRSLKITTLPFSKENLIFPAFLSSLCLLELAAPPLFYDIVVDISELKALKFFINKITFVPVIGVEKLENLQKVFLTERTNIDGFSHLARLQYCFIENPLSDYDIASKCVEALDSFKNCCFIYQIAGFNNLFQLCPLFISNVCRLDIQIYEPSHLYLETLKLRTFPYLQELRISVTGLQFSDTLSIDFS